MCTEKVAGSLFCSFFKSEIVPAPIQLTYNYKHHQFTSKLYKNLQERMLSVCNMPLSVMEVEIFWIGGGIQELWKFEFISDSFQMF